MRPSQLEDLNVILNRVLDESEKFQVVEYLLSELEIAGEQNLKKGSGISNQDLTVLTNALDRICMYFIEKGLEESTVDTLIHILYELLFSLNN
jgi:hypothetical protein